MTFDKTKELTRYDKIILLIIIVVAAVLRLWQLYDVPFMHDEFSALSRTRYDNLRDLIHEGVMMGDSHPAGVQVFLYILVNIFGWSEFWLKLPFALMGVGSVYLTFVIANQWFNKNVGLVSAAFVTVSELFVFYSQLARPYSPGLFFILLLVYFWNRILIDKRNITFWTCAGFALSAFFAAETQMFSMAQAGLIALTGLFFFKNLEKQRRKAYIWSCVAAVVLYLPSLPIFYYQLFVYGSIGGWLAKPTSAFFTDFLSYSMNYSKLFIFSMLIIALLPFIIGVKNRGGKIAIKIICLVWFVVPFALAFAYSLLKEPIIQFSTLIFSFPFLIIAVFSFFNEEIKIKPLCAVVGWILLMGVVSLVVDRQYFKQVYHQGFDQVAVEMKNAQERFGDSISFVSYSDRTLTTEFYQKRAGINKAKYFCEDDELIDYQQYLMNLDEDYIGVGLTDHADVPWELSAVAEYPYLVNENTWFTTRYLTLSKKDNGKKLLHILKENVEVQKGEEWVCGYDLPADEVLQCEPKLERIGFIADIQAVDTLNRLALIVEIIEPETEEKLFWKGYEINNQMILPGQRVMLTNGFFIPDIDLKGKIFKTYIWNFDFKALNVSGLSYYTVKKNAYFYGLYEPLK
ncbi:MAG: glycosyltransferase family 39 protein [Bacteroidales bacterium]|nr:glycosyltransferase family 39 protein [Bacteroidales bacterium]